MISVLKKSFCRACCAYSILSVFYLIIMLDLYKTNANPYPLTLLRLFPFCFLIALATTVVIDIKKQGPWKLALHFSILTLDLVFFIWLPFKHTLSPSTSLILALIYVVIYAIIAAIVSHFIGKRKETTSEYKSVYSQSKGK